MAVPNTMNSGDLAREHLEAGGVAQLAWMLGTFAEALMSADVEGICGAGSVVPVASGNAGASRLRQQRGYVVAIASGSAGGPCLRQQRGSVVAIASGFGTVAGPGPG